MNNYFNFLNKKLSIDLKSGLTVDERQLLEFLTMNASNGMPLCVAGAMSLSALASPATLHRRLDDLIAKGYISHRFEDDKRTKFLIPTSKATAYFKKVAELFEEQK